MIFVAHFLPYSYHIQACIYCIHIVLFHIELSTKVVNVGISWKWSIKSTVYFGISAHMNPYNSPQTQMILHTLCSGFVFNGASHQYRCVGVCCFHASRSQNYADRFWTATQSHKMAHWLRSIHANIRRNRTSEEDEKKNCRHNNYTVHRQCHVGESVCMYVRLCVRDNRCVHCPNNTHTYIWICRFLGNIIQLKRSARSKNDKLTLYRREKKEKEEEDEEYNDSLNKIGFENEVSKMGYAQL